MHQAASDRYEKMEYKRSGRSGIFLPRISLGLWQNFGTDKTLEEQKAILFKAFDLGITHFDLANNYGAPNLGLAEENFGSVLKSDLGQYREELFISTKAGFDFWPGPYGNWGSRKYLIGSLDASLRRMGLDYVDVYYHHRPDPETPLEETMGALSDLVKQGKALYIGISNYQADEAEKAIKILAANGTPCLLHQPRYNMLERWVEDGLLDVLDREGVGCICFSPLAQGALTGKYLYGIPQGSRASRTGTTVGARYLSTERLVKIKALNSLAESRGQSLAQMALAWALRRKEVTSVLIGASSPEQLMDNTAALKGLDFSQEELDQIDRILS
ncbi:aldo/keto reductase [Clostridium sp.]|uniref:aldo/keto reductase n=1 Tax=Clostridium sp. TaxID=1506 RepID=UPI00258AE087|nr:aldo/keto reductase [Clostridium sp.]MCI6140865.1 aldo/keto reductase [Clostridium sp.]